MKGVELSMKQRLACFVLFFFFQNESVPGSSRKIACVDCGKIECRVSCQGQIDEI